MFVCVCGVQEGKEGGALRNSCSGKSRGFSEVFAVLRGIHRASTVKLRAFIPCVRSGLLHAETSLGFCA
ncbi:hypothetical protein EVAR_76571_1 [Eumeta japonica]|uniref:Uncharacterized protein n=1 Tax=Eumeta variegata TaxID=151549 RepID=A0A4C1T611_EUMVA|nr:hypothetical protein EVAR_76571_1 [Eumeta japonica]